MVKKSVDELSSPLVSADTVGGNSKESKSFFNLIWDALSVVFVFGCAQLPLFNCSFFCFCS